MRPITKENEMVIFALGLKKQRDKSGDGARKSKVYVYNIPPDSFSCGHEKYSDIAVTPVHTALKSAIET